MLCHLDVSLSSDFSVVMVPFTESMLNSLSRSVCRSIEYLKEKCANMLLLLPTNMKMLHLWTKHTVCLCDICIPVILILKFIYRYLSLPAQICLHKTNTLKCLFTSYEKVFYTVHHSLLPKENIFHALLCQKMIHPSLCLLICHSQLSYYTEIWIMQHNTPCGMGQEWHISLSETGRRHMCGMCGTELCGIDTAN